MTSTATEQQHVGIKRPQKTGLKGNLRRRARGAAAVEFAVILPLFLLLIGGSISFGLAITARFQLTTIADAATRTCVLMNYQDTLVQNCAKAVAQTYITRYQNPCLTGTVSVVSNIQSNAAVAAPFNQTSIKSVVVQVSCTWKYFPLLDATSSFGTSISAMQLRALASMPYLSR